MNCPLLQDTKELNLIKEIQRIYTELREERDERKRLEKLLDEVLEERNMYKKFYWNYREQQDKDDWGI